MRNILVFCTLLLVVGGCSMIEGDKSKVENLINEWVKLNPDIIGGPSELKGMKTIQEIQVDDVLSKNKLICKDCKSTNAFVKVLYKDGNAKTIRYVVQNLGNNGSWSLTAWAIEGTNEKGNFWPYIDIDVIKARSSFNTMASNSNEEFEIQIKNDITQMLHDKVEVKNIAVRNTSTPQENVKKITFDCLLYFTADLYNDNGSLAFNKGMTVEEAANTFSYQREGKRWRLIKTQFGTTKSHNNADESRIISDDNAKNINEQQSLEISSSTPTQVPFSGIPFEVKYNGTYVDALRWADKNGTNYLIISEEKRGEYGKKGYSDILFGCSYNNVTGYYEKKWEIKEAADLVSEIKYIKASLKASDLDNDGVFENWFLYKKIGDGSAPIPLKLIMHSGTNKLPIRGEYCDDKVACGDYKKFTVVQELEKVPPSLKSFAIDEWLKVCKSLIK